MARALGPAKRAVVDSMGKDILKTARNNLSDKALGVQRGAVEVRPFPSRSLPIYLIS